MKKTVRSKNERKYLLIALLIISLLVLVGLLLNKQSTLTNSQPDPTANWKTYTNINVPFSFKYPPELSYFVQNDAESNGLKNILIQINNYASKPPYPEDVDSNTNYFNFWITGATTGANFESTLDDSDLGLEKDNRKIISIGGIEAFDGSGKLHGKSGVRKVMFKYQDWIFNITAWSSNSRYS